MDRIQQFLLRDADAGGEAAETNGIHIYETQADKQFILAFESGYTAIGINKAHMRFIRRFADTHARDPFSGAAIEMVGERFRLNSAENPVEYIYGLTSAESLDTGVAACSAARIDLSALQALNPNRFRKYPFRRPSDKLIYFCTCADGQPVSLASGYMDEVVELTGETLPEYRNRGYAKATTAAIAQYLLAKGHPVFTTNGVGNAASIRTVESLGFERYGRRMTFYTE